MKQVDYYNGFTIWMTYESPTHVRLEAEAYDSGIREGSGATLSEALIEIKAAIDEDPMHLPDFSAKYEGASEIDILFGI